MDHNVRLEALINTIRMNIWIDYKKRLFSFKKKWRLKNVEQKNTKKLTLRVRNRLS